MANRPAKPVDSPRLIPYLTVRDAAASLEFYERAFGFEPRPDRIMRAPDGSIAHCEMHFDEATIMFGPESMPNCPQKSPATSGVASPVSLYVYCDDVDELARRAASTGANIVSEPADMFWGDRICTITDPDGHQWMFATNVADFDPAKVPECMATQPQPA